MNAHEERRASKAAAMTATPTGLCPGSGQKPDQVFPGRHEGVCGDCLTWQQLVTVDLVVIDHRPNVPSA
jgi:hypothetical protein